MHSDVSVSLSLVYGFLIVLARVAGALVFVPIPGASRTPEMARIVLILSCTIALAPLWPAVAQPPGLGLLAGWMLAEAALGLTIGLVVGFAAEAFVMCGQMIGLQAGYSYASTIDPTTQSDSSVMSALAQLAASLLFFTLGLHREVIRVFALSLETCPPGGFALTPAAAQGFLRLGAGIFTVGLRLALPVIALMVMVDLALALLGRVNAQLQLISLAFPIKMLSALLFLAVVLGTFSRVYRGYASQLFEAIPFAVR
jgi:flagellar biosynthetic protein FliR